MRPLSVVFVCCPLLFAGCSDAGGAAAAAIVRDSAGVTIVESTAPAWAEGTGWRVIDTPSVDIGGRADDSAYDLFQVVGALRLADGRIAIADGGTQQLRFYAPDGTHLHTVGGVGEGPGEFTGLGLMVSAPGETLLTFDFRQLRISRFDVDGTFLVAFSLAGVDQATLQMIGVLDDGTVVSRTGGAFAPGSKPDGLSRDSALYVFHELPIAGLDTLGWFPSVEVVVKNAGGAVSMRSLPFGKHTTVVVHGARVFVGTADTYSISEFDASGVLRTVIGRPYQPIPVSPGTIETYKRSERDNMATQGDLPPNFRAMFEAMIDEMPYPEVHPPYQDFIVDRDGNVWVLDPMAEDDGAHTYQVFDSAGSWLGAVKAPEQFRPTDIGSDYVLGVWLGMDLVEHVQLYPLFKP